jgi:2-oxoglutarate dehydrogenase E2 component (dihydrolipoamide succinyltransferase)
MLTTFNEVDMGAVMGLRAEYKDQFEKRHGVKLGLHELLREGLRRRLQEFPAVNAEIEGDDVIYRSFINMGIAVGGPSGLSCRCCATRRTCPSPTSRSASAISASASRRPAQAGGDGGGSFTITNGGTYGSLMSTPILNPPQSGILGMHKIQDRPMAVGGKVEIRP